MRRTSDRERGHFRRHIVQPPMRRTSLKIFIFPFLLRVNTFPEPKTLFESDMDNTLLFLWFLALLEKGVNISHRNDSFGNV